MNASHSNEATQGHTGPDGGTGAQTERLRNAAHERIDTVAEAVHPVVNRLTDAAHDTVERVSGAAAGAAERMSMKSEEFRHMQGRLADDCREYVRAHPLKALGYAAAAGFILTRLLRG